MSITLVACIDMNNGIADADGNLLFNLPKDMRHFKAITSGKIVVMGRKTWESLPKRPLKKRKNYILTKNENYKADGATVLHDINDVLEMAKTQDIYVIGGGEIYDQFIPYADKMLLTQVHTVKLNARTFFPDFDYYDWKIVGMQKHEADKKHSYSFTFATYERKK